MIKPQIILNLKPAKIIRWFTEHWDKEVGALGVGKVENGNIIVEKLVFPTQVVNGAHVHFEPEDWRPVMEELTVEELGKIIFYWHKHPDNCVTASSTDEENTFEAFMAPEAKRKLFGFLQTAMKTGGSIDYEARIAIAKPIRVNTTDVELVMMDDNSVKKECEKIIKKKLTEGNKNTSDQPGMIPVTTTPVQSSLPNIVTTTEVVRPVSKSTKDLSCYVKDFKVEEKHGAIVIIYSPWYVSCVDSELNSKETMEMCSKFSHKVCESTGSFMTILQPKKKMIKPLLAVWEKIVEQVENYEEEGEEMEIAKICEQRYSR